ncbi:MAG: NAD(P)-binding domain-containing protein [Actinobacteria bacterium]|nr:NAD(P)-binding domain-containing protein [Actinomycetota bacterium]MBW3647956.1 NAD(P)-binding domain-containing protein [Actinomycetota bacterium]
MTVPHLLDRPSSAGPRPVRVAVLGAGPTGLEAALAAHQQGWDVTVYEQSAHVGAYVRAWGHVRLFTPWHMNVSPRAAEALGVPVGADCPTGTQYAEHLDRVAALLPDVRLSTRVLSIAREGLLKNEEIGSAERGTRPFRLLVEGPEGAERIEVADVVLDCTGTYGNPNPLGHGGIPAPGERILAHRISHEIPLVDAGWAGRRVLLVGAGYSAQTAARDLVAAGAEVVWAVRRAATTWGAVPADPLPDRAALVASSQHIASGAVAEAQVLTGVLVDELRPAGGGVAVVLRDAAGAVREVVVDEILSMTGSVGDSRLYRQLQVHECYATEGPITLAATLLGGEGGDCLAQSSAGVDALRNPEPRFFVLGSKSYGRNNTFLLRVGWEQVAEVVADLATEFAPREGAA